MTFKPDGSFAAVQLPVQIFARDLFLGPFTGSGNWTLVPAKENDAQHLRLTLGPTVIDSVGIDQHSGTVRIYFWIGDPDVENRYWLCHADDRQCPSPRT
ncbi:MAG TPA: hypothetical protein VFR11_07065 [Micromonosporaceae bacterium]|nr:hypothetical protein [Micromonosporaceae bacterium]